MASIKFKEVGKSYDGGTQFAVKGLTLEIPDKEFVVFVGPSGCGKSTALRMIAGLEEITEGELYIGDVLCNNVKPKNRDIAMVFQSYALYPHMSVEKNIAFGLQIKKMSKQEIKDKVDEVAKMLSIEEYLDRFPRALSGGQRQRVALGRALVRHPKVFLLDEPLSNLDAKLRTQMRAEISALHKRVGITFIYVTHDQIEAMTMGTKIVVMKDGIMQQYGTPQDVFNHPVNMFVAGFIGSPQMNFFDIKIDKEKDKYRFTFANKQTCLVDCSNLTIEDKYLGKEVILGIRPEYFHLGNDNSVEVEVDIIENLGAEILIYANLGHNPLIAKLGNELEDEVSGKSKLKLSFLASKIHLFDKQTHLSITSNPESINKGQ